ncbi:MAG: ShlB/FhaC/HecB family hemolysin secretion/activation protein [Vampirovibrionales bacterium]|nr:ShlB/FhaC/HecB family hemolysin secretion/activation protein [Vampirovibrionales bacterium]
MRTIATTSPFSLALSLCVAGVIAVFASGNVAYADIQPDPAFRNLPTGVPNPGLPANPGLQSDPDDLTLPEAQRKDRKNSLDQKTDVEQVKLDVPEPASAKVGKSPVFHVNEITVEGVSIFKAAEIDAMTAEYKGKDLTLEDLNKLVEDLNQLYRSKGYLTSQAYIPPQDIVGGKVLIQVQEGKIGAIKIAGNRFYRTWAIERNLPQEPGDVLNIRDLEKSLNRINQQENFRLKAVLSPGEQAGQTDLRLDVAERQPWQIALTTDNQGRPYIGFYRYGVELTNQNLLGIGDKLFAKWIGARGDGTNVVMAGYTLPLSRFGTEVSYNFAYSKVNVLLPIGDPPEIEGTSQSHSVIFSQPLNANRNVVVDAGFNFKNIYSFFNNDRTNHDGIYSAQFGMNVDKVDRLGRTFMRGQFTFAPDWGGKYNRKFSKYEVMFTRLTRLPLNNLLIMRANAQFSPDALPSAEQFQIGGNASVRGYTEGLITGDRGWSFTLEDRFPIPLLRRVSPFLADRIQGALFFDLGQAWLDESNLAYVPALSHQPGRTLLVGGGVGLRARISRYAQGFVDLGFGMVDRQHLSALETADPTLRVHFGIRSELLPDVVRFDDNSAAKADAKSESKEAKKDREKTRKDKKDKDADKKQQALLEPSSSGPVLASADQGDDEDDGGSSFDGSSDDRSYGDASHEGDDSDSQDVSSSTRLLPRLTPVHK